MATLASTIPSSQRETSRSENQLRGSGGGTLRAFSATLAVIAALFTTTSCSNQTSGSAAPAPVDVEVARVEQRDVPIYSEWIGTLDGYVNADIKAQVTGYLQEQSYQEGTFVKKGRLLFQIDPRPFQAVWDLARGRRDS